MKILADESVDGAIVAALRTRGQDVTYVAELTPGIPDAEVLRMSAAEGRFLITSDKDFGDLVFRRKQPNTGVLLLRLAGMPNAAKGLHVAITLERFEAQLPGRFAVLTQKMLRIRPAEPPPPA